MKNNKGAGSVKNPQLLKVENKKQGRNAQDVGVNPTQPSIFHAALISLLVLSTLIFFEVASYSQGKGEGIYSDTEIVNAIYRAENSKKYPYGIKSIDTKGNKEYARKICFNSVRNGRARWIKAGKPDDLIVFIGKRYSPPCENPNWVRLVKHFLTKEGGR